VAEEENSAEVRIGADTEDATDALQRFAGDTGDALDKLKGHFNSTMAASVALGEALEHFAEKALDKVKEALERSIETFASYGKQIEHMQIMLGGSAEENSRLATALDIVGMSTERYTMMALRLSMQLEHNQAAFDKYQVATRGANNELLPTQEIIGNVVKRLAEYKAGADRNQVGTELLGRSYRMMGAELFHLIDVQEEAKKISDEFGLTLSEDNVKAAYAYEKAINSLHVIVKGFYSTVGQYLIPSLTILANDIKDNAGPAFDDLRKAMGPVVAFFEGLKTSVMLLIKGFVELYAVMNFKQAVEDAMMLGAAHHSLTETVNGIKQAWKELGDVTTQVMADIDANIMKSADTIQKAMNPPKSAAAEEGGARAPKPGADGTPLKEFEQQLEAMEAAQDAYHQLSKSQIAAFWYDTLSSGKVAQKDLVDAFIKTEKAINAAQLEAGKAWEDDWTLRYAFAKGKTEEELELLSEKITREAQLHGVESAEYNKVLEEEVALVRKATEEMIKEDKRASESALKTLEARQAAQRDKLDSAVSLGSAEPTDKIKLEMDQLNEKRRLEEQIDAQAVADAKGNEEATSAALDKQKLDYEKYVSDMAKLDRDLLKERVKSWQDAFSSINNTLVSNFDAMLKHTETWHQAMHKIARQLGMDIINDAIIKPMLKWIEMQLLQLVFTKEQAAQMLGIQLTNDAAGTASKVTAATTQVEANAAVGATGAAASVAAIPFTGWMMAGGVFAATLALLKGVLGSFATGAWDLSGDQIAQVHKGEMIIPAGPAEAMRQGLSGGGAGGMQVHIHGVVNDAAAMKSFFMNNQRHVAAAAMAASRNRR
jgi:hypothetical protein